MPKLQISLLEHGEVTHELSGDRISVGRHADNAVQIDDASISTHHAEIRLEDGSYWLKDLNSTNGTRVNDKSGGEWQLQEGDKIRFGKVVAFFVSDSSQVKAPMPEADEPVVAAAEQSKTPSSFSNASPFKTKAKESTPGGLLSIIVAIVAILVFLAMVVIIQGL